MNKLTSKDLITIGIFSAIYIATLVIISGFVIIPVLQIAMMPVMALVTGPIYLLFLARLGKFGGILIMGFLTSALVGLLVYGNVYCFLVNMLFFVLGEVIAFIGKYKSDLCNGISFIVSSFSVIGEAGLPWVAGKYFYDLSIKSGYTQEWASGVDALATPFNLGIMVVATVICGVFSILLAKSMFKKHFKKAGII